MTSLTLQPTPYPTKDPAVQTVQNLASKQESLPKYSTENNPHRRNCQYP